MAIPSNHHQPLAGNLLATSTSTSTSASTSNSNSTDTDTGTGNHSSASLESSHLNSASQAPSPSSPNPQSPILHSPSPSHPTTPSPPNQKQILNQSQDQAHDQDQDRDRDQDQNLILNRHPSINFLNNSSPVPSFPPTIPISALKALKQASEANFLANFHHTSPAQLPSTDLSHLSPTLGPATLRLVDHPPGDVSQIALPHPNPDLSIASPAPNPPPTTRRISALPNRANTPFKPFRALPSPLPTPRNPLSPSPDVPQAPRTPCYPTASAAISGALGPSVAPPATIDRVLAELQHRAEQAPGCGQALFGPPAAAQPAPPPAVDRFAAAHGKQFAKADSIATHYAAKRKNDAPVSGPSAAAAKRAKVSEFGNPKRVVSEQPDAAKRQANARRQLEMARARRRTGTGASTAGPSAAAQKAEARPAPGRLGAFGRSMVRSAVKTVKSAFRRTPAPDAPTGVGFGAPAGLGVGPAKAPVPKKIPSPAKVAPKRLTTAGPSTRLLPAGTRIASAASAALSDASRRRVAAGPAQRAVSASCATKPLTGVAGNGGRGPTVATTAVGAAKTATKISWQPKTVPKPRAGPGGTGAQGAVARQQPLAKPRAPAASGIPQLRTRAGETIIRPTTRERVASVCSGFMRTGSAGVGKMKQPTKTTRPVAKVGAGGKGGVAVKGRRKSSLAVGARGGGHRVGSGSGFVVGGMGKGVKK